MAICSGDVQGLRAQPVFNNLVTEVIYTEYPDGSVEWNMVLTGCPGGFIRLFAHRIEVLDTAPARVGIRGADSWIRGCDFELRRVDTTNDLRINGPECSGVAITPGSWSRIKARY